MRPRAHAPRKQGKSAARSMERLWVCMRAVWARAAVSVVVACSCVSCVRAVVASAARTRRRASVATSVLCVPISKVLVCARTVH